MHTLAGCWKSREETRRTKKKKIQKTQAILQLKPGITKENLLPKTIKLGGNKPLAPGASSSVHQESQKNTEATWDHYLHLLRDTSHYMEAVFPMVRKIHGKQPDDPMEGLNVNLAIWGMFMNTTLRAAFHLGKDYDKNLRFVKNSLDNNRTSVQGNRKANQWSDRNHWHKLDQFPRFKVGIDKLIAQSSFSMCHCQSLCLLRLCALLGKIGRQSNWMLEEASSMVFRQRLLQRIESNWWTTCGIRVEDFPKIHDSGHPQWDSTDDGRITVWTR